MDFVVTQTGPNAVVSFGVRTELEGEASTAFKDRLKALVKDGAKHVVLDLGNVAFLDSGGLGALIGCLKALQQAEGRLVLANLSQPVDSVLRVTRLDRVFDVRSSVADALASLGSAPIALGAPVGAGRGA